MDLALHAPTPLGGESLPREVPVAPATAQKLNGIAGS